MAGCIPAFSTEVISMPDVNSSSRDPLGPDLSPWAAYVLARDASMLDEQRSEFWLNSHMGDPEDDPFGPRLRDPGDDEDGVDVEVPRDPEEDLLPWGTYWDIDYWNIHIRSIEIMNTAIGHLARRGHCQALPLHQYHLNLFVYLMEWERVKHPFHGVDPTSDNQMSHEPAQRELWRVQRSVSDLLPTNDELRLWASLGDVVGQFLSSTHPGSPMSAAELSELAIALMGPASQLRTIYDYTFLDVPLESITSNFMIELPYRSPVPWGQYRDERWNELASLDDLITESLSLSPPPEPWLVLDAQRPTLFGRPIPRNVKADTLLGGLRALAIGAGRVVSLEEFRNGLNSGAELENLKWVVHKLRRLLKPLEIISEPQLIFPDSYLEVGRLTPGGDAVGRTKRAVEPLETIWEVR